jgi:hypothetical protein
LNNAPVLRERDYFFTWAQFVVCNAICSLVVGGLAGAIAGIVLAIAQINRQLHPTLFMVVTGGAGFLAGLPVSYLLFRLFVSYLWERKHAEMANAATAPSAEPQPPPLAGAP